MDPNFQSLCDKFSSQQIAVLLSAAQILNVPVGKLLRCGESPQCNQRASSRHPNTQEALEPDQSLSLEPPAGLDQTLSAPPLVNIDDVSLANASAAPPLRLPSHPSERHHENAPGQSDSAQLPWATFPMSTFPDDTDLGDRSVSTTQAYDPAYLQQPLTSNDSNFATLGGFANIGDGYVDAEDALLSDNTNNQGLLRNPSNKDLDETWILLNEAGHAAQVEGSGTTHTYTNAPSATEQTTTASLEIPLPVETLNRSALMEGLAVPQQNPSANAETLQDHSEATYVLGRPSSEQRRCTKWTFKVSTSF